MGDHTQPHVVLQQLAPLMLPLRSSPQMFLKLLLLLLLLRLVVLIVVV